MVTRTNRCSLLAFELRDPITLIPHIANDHEDVKLNRDIGGVFILSLYTWHLWYFQTYSTQSLSMII
jgi:hypothetical protein